MSIFLKKMSECIKTYFTATSNNDLIYDKAMVFNFILQHLNIREGEKVLEIGCSTGFMQKKLEDRLIDVTGIDIDQRALDENSCGKKVFMNAECLQFEENAFDKIYSAHTIEHIDNLQEVFKGVSHILKSGGICVMVYPWELFRGMAGARYSFEVYGNPFLARKCHLHKLNPKKINYYISGTNLKQIASKLIFAKTPQYISVLKKIV